MPSRLASDRPIKNVIGSVDQILLQRGGAGRWVGGQQWLRWEGGRTTGVVQREKEGKSEAELCTLCLEALGHGYRGVQLLCFVVCLFLGQGHDDLSLFVGISGSVMWL